MANPQGTYGPSTSSSAAVDWTSLPGVDPTKTFNANPVWTPPDPNAEPVDPLGGPGSMEIDITDPVASASEIATESTNVADGLRRALFGTSVPDARGKRNGVFGDVPVIGDIGRAAGDINQAVGEFVVGVPGAVADIIGGGLEHLSLGVSEELRQKFNAIEDPLIKEEAFKAMKADPAQGEGAFTAAAHYMTQALEQWDERKQEASPDLWDNIFVENASMADVITNMFGTLGAAQRGTERLWAGLSTPGQQGMNRLQTIMAVGDGLTAFNEDKGILGTGLFAGGDTGLNQVEQIVYNNYKSKKWTETQALDYLASHGAGLSHAASMQVLGSLGLDPLNVASLGALAIAKTGYAGVRLNAVRNAALDLVKDAEKLSGAQKVEALAEANKMLEIAEGGIRSADTVGRFNALGQIATTRWSGQVLRKYGAIYEAVGHTSVGKVAKITRTIIDPFHLWGDSPRLPAIIEEGSEEVARIAARTHGEANHGAVIYMLGSAPGVGRALVDDFERGIAITLANDLRRITARRYQAVQAWRGTLDQLRKDPTIKGIKDALLNSTKDVVKRIEEEVTSFIKYNWTEDDLDNLAERASAMMGGYTKEQWRTMFKNGDDWNAERLSLLHRATYGMAIHKLHVTRELVRASGATGKWVDRLDDLILLNRQTLTDFGATGIIKRLDEAASLEDKMAVIAHARHQYPQLRNFRSDPTSMQRTIDAFREHLESMKARLPHQIEDAERVDPEFPQALRDFDKLITPDPTTGSFTIAFRPKQEFLWGIDEDITGQLHIVSDPWFDQVSDVSMDINTYRGVRETSYNVAGAPLPVRAASRLLDYGEMAGRTLYHGVTGKMVTQAAHKKFVANVYRQVGSKSGISEAEVELLWDELRKAVDERVSVSGMRGLSKHDMWSAAKKVTHAWPHAANYGPRELMVDVMKAYEGDLRTVGITQKLTGRVKTMVAEAFGANYAGEIAEHLWPLLKFRFNPLFHVQEKIEPWVLGGGRGVNPAAGRTPNEVDRMTAAIYKRYLDSSLVNMADQDIAELSAKFAIGSELEMLSMDRGSAIALMREKLSIESLLDVQGTKRLNMLRTFQKGLGENLRSSWDRHLAGEWDKMAAHYAAQHGYRMSDDEIAVRIMYENLSANDVFVKTYKDANGNPIGWEVDFDNSIQTGMESAPQHIGELRTLNMERMVRRVNLMTPDGQLIADEVGMRRALAAGDITWDRIERELRDLGANEDYIKRVHANLSFNWNTFWDEVRTSFNMTDEEITRLRNYFRSVAQRRQMTPVEYLSQIFAPTVAKTGDALVGALGNTVEFLRNGRELATLVASPTGAIVGGVPYEFYKQMAKVIVSHLDPSAKRNFIIGLIGTSSDPGPLHHLTGNAILDNIADIDDFFDKNAIDEFASRIMGFYQGTPPTGTARVVDAAELPGLAFIRDHATERLTAAGRTPRGGNRLVVQNDEALRQRGAQAYDDLTSFARTYDDEATEINLDVVRANAETTIGAHGIGALRPAAARLGPALQTLYTDYVNETRKLYLAIIDDLGVTIKKRKSGYANADELRADLSRVTPGGARSPILYVSTEDLWHPILKADDAFMVRVVNSVYGHGQEATQFGDDAAIMSAATMYPDHVRGVHLTDNWAKQSWESSSQQVIPPTPARPTNADEYVSVYGDVLTDERVGMLNGPRGSIQNRTVGDGARVVGNHPKLGRELFGNLHDLRSHTPSVPFGSIEIVPHYPNAPLAFTTVDSGFSTPHIVILETSGYELDDAVRDNMDLRREAGWKSKIIDSTVSFPRGSGSIIVDIPGNVAAHVSHSRTSDLYHEYGHVVDMWLHKTMEQARRKFNRDRQLHPGPNPAPHKPYDDLGYLDKKFQKWYKAIAAGETRKRISGYANVPYPGQSQLADADLFAELFDLSFNPELAAIKAKAAARRKALIARIDDPNDAYDGTPPGFDRKGLERQLGRKIGKYEMLFDPDYVNPRSIKINTTRDYLQIEDSRFWNEDGTLDTELMDMADEFRAHLVRMKIWVEDPVAKPNPHAGRTVAEVNAGYQVGAPSIFSTAELTPRQAEAIGRYQSGSQIGDYMRGTSVTDAEALDSVIAGVAPIPAAMTLYRGVDPETIDDLLTSTTKEFGYYLSTSASPGVAVGFASRPTDVVRIEVPAGTRLIDMQALGEDLGQSEYLLPRNARFSVRKDGDEIVLTMEPQYAVKPKVFGSADSYPSPFYDPDMLSIPHDPDYLYHATPASNLGSIARSGLEPRVAADGSDPNRFVYFSQRPVDLTQAPGSNAKNAAVVRVRRDRSGAQVAPGYPPEVFAEYRSPTGVYPGDIEYMAEDGTWVQITAPGPAPVTVGGPGTIKAQTRAGSLPQDLVDELTANYLGTGRYAEPNPDVARLAHYSRGVMEDAATSFFGDIGAGTTTFVNNMPYSFDMPTDVFGPAGLDAVNAVPFDYSQGLLWDAAVQGMANKWEDAFRLQYFAQERSMLQRSINHPLFGLYPASYMWGKILPELIKFIALEPFGMNTGAGARMLADVQMSVAMQRENDPEFDKQIEDLGHSPSLDFLSYLLPATPWSVPSSYPSWMRSFAEQGLQMEKDALEGDASKDINWTTPALGTVKRLIPALTQIPWLGRVKDELTGNERPREGTREYKVWLAEEIAKNAGNQPVQPVQTAQPQGGQTTEVPPGPVPAASLAPVLDDSLEQLQQLFGN